MSSKILSKNNLRFFIPILFILCGTYLRLHFLMEVPSFWLDTCFLANNLERSYIDLFKPLDNVQVAPPLFLVISKFLLNITDSTNELIKKDFVLLLLPCICSILSMPLFLYLTNKMFKNDNINIVSSFLLAFSPIAVNYAIEYKQYSCELMFALILLIIFYSIDLKNITIKKLSIYSTIIALSIWFSLSSFFLIASGFSIILYKIFKEKILDRKRITILFLPFLLSATTFFLTFYIPVHNVHSEAMKNFWMYYEPSFISLNNFVALLREKLEMYDYIVKLPIDMFLFLGLSILILIFNRNNKATATTLLPIFFVLLSSSLKLYPFSPRLILFLLPLFIIITTQIFTLFKEKIITTIVLSSIFLFFAFGHIKNINNWYIFHNFYSRELVEILINKNPELKNVISDNHVYPYYIEKEPLLTDYMSGNGEVKIFDFLENTTPDTYWILVPTVHGEYNTELLNYLANNKKIKITEQYNSKTDWETYLLQIEKL